MKAIDYRSSIFGKGTNPGGGQYVSVIPETGEEANLIDGKVGEKGNIYKRLVRHNNGIPLDGGNNPIWDRLQVYIQDQTGTPVDLITWAKAEAIGMKLEKLSDLCDIEKIEINKSSVLYKLKVVIPVTHMLKISKRSYVRDEIKTIDVNTFNYNCNYRLSYRLSNGWHFKDFDAREEVEKCIEEYIEKVKAGA